MKEEIDPIIAELANPERIAPKARSLFRNHRPAVESAEISEGFPRLIESGTILVMPYDVIFSALDAITRRSIDPLRSRELVMNVVKLIQESTPEYEQIEARRLEAARTRAEHLTQQGKKVILTQS